MQYKNKGSMIVFKIASTKKQRKRNSFQKRILKLAYKKGVFKKLGITKFSWEPAEGTEIIGGKLTYINLGYNLVFYHIGSFGEVEAYSIVDTVFRFLIHVFEHKGVLTEKKAIEYLKQMPTTVGDHRINSYLKIERL